MHDSGSRRTVPGCARRDGAVVVDVREPLEYRQRHVPARLIPLGQVRARLELLRQGPVYVICASGSRSRTAASLMTAVGIDARSVAGGTDAWIRAGGPVVGGPHADAT
jgi:rhodanese-related sulfurtransferase